LHHRTDVLVDFEQPGDIDSRAAFILSTSVGPTRSISRR